MSGRASAHVDTFVRDHLPPRDLWPQVDWSGVPELAYPDQLNAAAPLLDEWMAWGLGARPALRHAEGVWSYQSLFETSNRIAHVLVEDLGLVPGGRVLLRAANQPLLVACWFGVIKAGGVAVTTMPLLRTRELGDIIEQANVTLAITDARVAADLESAMAGRRGARVVYFSELESSIIAKPDTFPNVLTAADDPAIIAFTSGTTGRSKGTIHTHRDLLAVADTYGRYVLKPTSDDIFVGSPPIAFTYALGGLVLFPMRFGASTALIEQASPPLLLEAIQKFRATITITSPTAYRAMLKQVGGFDLRSLKKCVSAGETLPAATFDAWERATGIRLMDGIGSTEMLHMFIGSQAADARPGSTGQVVPGFKARVVDESGAEVARGTVGRLAVSGPTGCRYLGDVPNQQKYVQRAWNLTGDAYLQDADGYFWYQARTDDMIISSGYNIASVEVENVLLTHPTVAECAVVGIPDEARGQIVKAFVVPVAGVGGSDSLAITLQDFVKSELAPYKYPRAIEFVAELPRTLTGKLQRYRLRPSGPSGPSGPASAPNELMQPSSPLLFPMEDASPGRSSHQEPDGPDGPDRPDGPDLSVLFHNPRSWPRPSGYSNAASATGRTVFVAGQVGWDPVTMAFAGGEFASEVRQALANVVAALEAAGARPDQITRLTWYITDRDAYLQQRAEIGRAYREVIGRHFPAMSVVVVKALIEDGARVEIEATAMIATG